MHNSSLVKCVTLNASQIAKCAALEPRVKHAKQDFSSELQMELVSPAYLVAMFAPILRHVLSVQQASSLNFRQPQSALVPAREMESS